MHIVPFSCFKRKENFETDSVAQFKIHPFARLAESRLCNSCYANTICLSRCYNFQKVLGKSNESEKKGFLRAKPLKPPVGSCQKRPTCVR